MTSDDQTTLANRAAQAATVADIGASGAELTKSGSEKWYVGAISGTPIADITLSLVWTNNAGTVELKSLERSGERLGLGNSTHPEILTVKATYTAGAMATKTVTITATLSETAVVTQDGETTTMERTVTTDSVVRLVKVSLTPIDSGYTVVVIAADGSTTNWTGTQAADGTWTLTDAAGAV